MTKPKGERVFVKPKQAEWLRRFAASVNMTPSEWVNEAIRRSVADARAARIERNAMLKERVARMKKEPL